MRKKDLEQTKQYLRNIYKNDSQNTIVEMYISNKNEDVVDKNKTTFDRDDIFALFVLRDIDFLEGVFKENKKEIKEMYRK